MATAASLIKVSWLKGVRLLYRYVACHSAVPTQSHLQATAILFLVVFFLLGAAWQGHSSSHVSY